MTRDCLHPDWSGHFCEGLAYCIFVVSFSILNLCVLIWACLQKEEIFGSFHFMQ